ncbi:MAG: tetratricopeptide repeat protein [Treponema sp.]|nr:tetratricopeptide repeat protein [Treponema sp.]
MENSKETDEKKKKIIIVIAAALILFILGGAGVSIVRGMSASNSKKDKTIALVNLYYQKGEYDRALDKLESILMENPEDKEALALMEKILASKSSAEKGESDLSSNSNVNVTVDTEGLQDAMQSSLDMMKEQLAKSNENLKAQIAKSNEESEKTQKAMADLLKKQQEQAALEKKRQEDLIAKQKEAEEERKKAEEIRKREEENRKKAEEALMKKNAAVRKEIAGVNDEIQQGKSALNSGSLESAIEHFSKATNLLPVASGDPEYEPEFSASKHSEIAGLLYDASQKASAPEDKARLQDMAVQYAQKAVEMDPKAAESLYILGMDAYEKKNYSKSLDYLTKAVENNNSNAFYYYNLGRVQFQMKKFTEAKYSFSTACQLDGNYAQARYNLGLTNKRLNDSKSALSDFRKVHSIDSHHENSYLEEARLLVKMGDYAGAESAYKSVIRINNTNRNALNELGTVYSNENKYPEAEASFRQSLALLPSSTEDPLTYYNLSTVLFEQNKTDDSIAYAKKAYDTSSVVKNVNARANIIYNYALICEKTGKIDEAITKYSEVLKLNPRHLKSLINLGVMYMGMNPPDSDMALSLFNRAYSEDKNNFEVNNNLGSAYLSKEDYANSIKYFQTALKIEPKNNDVRYNLATAFASDRQFDNAQTTYKELLKQEPDNWDGYIELAKVTMALGDNAMAEKYLMVVQIKAPNHRKAEVDDLLRSLK